MAWEGALLGLHAGRYTYRRVPKTAVYCTRHASDIDPVRRSYEKWKFSGSATLYCTADTAARASRYHTFSSASEGEPIAIEDAEGGLGMGSVGMYIVETEGRACTVEVEPSASLAETLSSLGERDDAWRAKVASWTAEREGGDVGSARAGVHTLARYFLCYLHDVSAAWLSVDEAYNLDSSSAGDGEGSLVRTAVAVAGEADDGPDGSMRGSVLPEGHTH